jgi:prolyl oligopeptidase
MKYITGISLMTIASLFPAHGQNMPIEYPQSTRQSVVETFFGEDIPDPYRWLEEPAETPEVQTWIRAQQSLFEAYMKGSSFRELIHSILTEKWNYPRYGTPSRYSDYLVYAHNPGLLNQSRLYYRKGNSKEEVLLIDPNTFSKDGTASLSDFSFSKDGRYFAYAISESGSDWKTIHVRDMQTGNELTDRVPNVKFSGISWFQDGFVYSRFPRSSSGAFVAENTGQQVCFHKLGTSYEKDIVLYEDASLPRHGKYGYVTRDQELLVLSLNSGTYGNNLMVRSLSQGMPGGKSVFLTREFSSQSSVVWHENGTVWVQTDLLAPNQRLVRIDLKRPVPRFWENEIAEKEDAVLQSVYRCPQGWLALYTRNVKSEMILYTKEGEALRVSLPAEGTINSLSVHPESGESYLSISAYNLPPTIYSFNTSNLNPEVFFPSQAKVDMNPERYTQEQVRYRSKDGTEVPMYLFYRKDLPLSNRPVFLYGYGGFNISVMPNFSLMYWLFAEAGGVVAVPALRGGSEFGQRWHESGMLLNKMKVFEDFIGAAEYLIARGITRPEKIAIHGRSNGGLLVGACMVLRPDLFKVAVPAVGVLDMLRFHKFTIGHAWMVEYGNPEIAEDFKNLLSYSPLHRLKKGTAYPATLVMTADHDDRVVPAHSFKFTAALQHAQGGDLPALIRIDSKAGHGAGKSTAMLIDEIADLMAFILRHIGEN